ncbi:MAG: ABC transporter ATP-binding protein [Proteiniphilum sp.]|nr:ABC transporter ATP-binding protein [Proteiniphilum sp.]
MIQTKHLEKTYRNGFRAVKDLSLHVEKGDIFGFLGPNGAGKTTTIRMLDGLLTLTRGKVLIGGMEVDGHASEIRRMIGVVPESHGYYYWMTAKEYLQYFYALFNHGGSDEKYLRALLAKVGLADKADVPVGQFSRGMKQRLGIAKALVNRPQIIFLDEPTLGLDPRGQREIQQLLFDINKSDGITIFITSHMLKDIEVLCNKVCIIKDGSLVEQGSIRELQEKYRDGYSMLLQTSDNEAAEGLIRKLKKVARVAGEDGQLLIECESGLSDDEVLSVKHELVTAILSNGLDIREMTHKTLSMEDIFFKVTDAEKEGIA